MSTVKIGPNQHVGYQELIRYRSFIESKYANILKAFVSNFGVFKNLIIDPAFDNLKVIPGTGTGKYTLQAGYALDKDFNLIHVPNNIIDAFDVSAAAPGTYYAVIAYQERIIEEGTVNIDAAGILTGTNTKFTEVLRGQPFHSTKIKFTNAATNTGEYEVLSVANNTSAIIQGNSFAVESNLTYKVVGTFTPGKVIPSGDKDIYKYDSALLTAKTGAPVAGVEFRLAQIPVGVGAPVDDRDNYLLELI